MTGLEKAISELYRLHTQIAVAGAAVTGVIEAQGLAGTCHEAIITHLADSARLADGIAEEMEKLRREHKEHQATADTDAQVQAKAREQTIAYLRVDIQRHVDAGRLTAEQADGWAERAADTFRDSIARGGASKTTAEYFGALIRSLEAELPEETKVASSSRNEEIGDRKILHMQVRGRGSKQEVVALCDDGSLWLGDWGAEDREGGVVYPDNFGWWRLPAVPGSNPAAGRPEREAL